MIYNTFNKILGRTLGVALLAGCFLTACEDKVVDLKPVDAIPNEDAYATAERCELSVIGAYDAAQSGIYYQSDPPQYTRGYPFGAASIIQGEMRGEDMNLTAQFYDYTYSATYTTSTANNVTMWEASFEAINRYNTVMKNEEEAKNNGVISQDTYDQYEGECLFLRALTYHNLMVHFALPYNVEGNNDYGLPLYLTPHTTPEEIQEGLKIGRSSVKDTYKQIIQDLDDAERLLPEAIASSPITRASKGAAIALKTRVYLHMRDWDNVITEAKKLMGTDGSFTSPIGGYGLEDNPATPFTSADSNKESIFSIENSSDDNPSVNGALFAMFSGREGGRAMCPTSPTLYNSTYWPANDKRRNLLYYLQSEQEPQSNYYYCDKYTSLSNADNAPLIRYAEVLLNYAEAALRDPATDNSTALKALNAVRGRSTDVYKASAFATNVDMLNAILWERRIEFNGEGRRWEDIHRLAADDLCPSGGIPRKIEYSNVVSYQKSTGQSAFNINGAIDDKWYGASKKLIPYTDKRFIWPIPINDLLRNPTLAKQQNAGW